MGQAKLRGSPEQRANEAKARQRAQFAAVVTCNNCQSDLTEIQNLDIRGIEGRWHGVSMPATSEIQACFSQGGS